MIEFRIMPVKIRHSKKEEGKHLFRYMEMSYGDYILVYCEDFLINGETEKGYYINGNDKWVSKTSKKRYAHLSKQEAIQSYVARKKRQKKILENQLSICSKCLYEIEKEIES